MKLPAPLVRIALAGHSALGLATGLILLVVVMTGTAAMFVPEFDGWQQRHLPRLERLEPAIALGAMAGVPVEAGGWRRFSIEYPTASLPRPILTAAPIRGDARRFAIDANGGLTPIAEPWSRFLVDLHERLTIPGTTGLVVVGILGIAMLALVAAGVLAHPRLFRDAFLLRTRAGERRSQADFHNRLSVWPLPFHVAIAFTGAAIALVTPTAALVARYVYQEPLATIGTALLGPTAGKDRSPATLPDLPAALAAVDGAVSPIQRVIVDGPGTNGQIVRVDVRAPSRLAYGDRLFFDARGLALNPGGMLEHTAGLGALSAFFALHFGSFGGLPLRVAYGLLGLALCGVVSSGMRVWLARRRGNGRSLPILERLWVGWVWGCAFALPASFAGTLLGATAAPVFIGAWILALSVSLLVRSDRAARSTLVGATIVAAVAVVMTGY